MKVLFIATADYKYGAPKAMMELIQELNKKDDVEVMLLTKRRNRLNDWCDRNEIENGSFWYRDIMAGSAYQFWGLNLLKHIIKYICYAAGNLTQKKIVESGLDFGSVDIIHTNMGRIDIGAYLAHKFCKIHIWHLRELESGHVKLVKYKRHCIEYMNNNADAFIGISEAVKNNWEKAGLDGNKIKVIFDGIDTESVQKKKKRKDSFLKIAMVGRIEVSKGQLSLVKAMKYLPEEMLHNIRIDFIGEGYASYINKIKHSIKELNLENIVSLKGYQDNVNIRLKDYDIGVNCSRGEAFGRITVEYMAAGLAAVVSDTGANKEIIHNNIDGIIYSYGDDKDLADKLLFLYQDEEARNRLSQKAIEKSRLYNKAKNAEEVYGLYRELLWKRQKNY